MSNCEQYDNILKAIENNELEILESQIKIVKQPLFQNKPLLLTAIEKQNFQILKFLIEQGSNVNEQDIQKRVFLHYCAINSNNLELCKLLIEQNKDLMLINKIIIRR
eukprot:TRINITY_DN1714_c0_g1_i3.p1 TRINITY_DN1714_c0_g1~~TRINITY_DN1714_c0_g1_i3.p1  ORF type:complete len:107 (+),score=18.94 TRINITY_DN1714_c0_g1_i3:101-421(+)